MSNKKNNTQKIEAFNNTLQMFSKEEMIDIMRDFAQIVPRMRFDKSYKSHLIFFCQLLEDDFRNIEE